MQWGKRRDGSGLKRTLSRTMVEVGQAKDQMFFSCPKYVQRNLTHKADYIFSHQCTNRFCCSLEQRKAKRYPVANVADTAY